MGSGGTGTTTSTNISEPPGYLQEPLQNYAAETQYQAGTPYSTYGGERVAPLNANIQQGIEQASTAPTLQSATSMVDNTLRGDYFNNNPYLDEAYRRGADAVETSGLNSAFGDASGLSNSGAQRSMEDQRNRLAYDVYAGNYANERQNQFKALPYAASLPQAQAGLSFGAGDVERQYDQQRIDNQIGMFNEERGYPQQQLDNWGRAIGGMMGGGFGSDQSQNPYFMPSPAASAIGGGMAGIDIMKFLSELDWG